MNTQTLFRALVLASLFTSIAAMVVDYTAPNHASSDWKAVLEWDGDGGFHEHVPDELPTSWIARILLGTSIFIAIAFTLFIFVSQIGLLFFWKFSRPGFLVGSVFWLALNPFGGLYVAIPLEATLYQFVGLCEGAILAMAYFSPLSERFSGRRPSRD